MFRTTFLSVLLAVSVVTAVQPAIAQQKIAYVDIAVVMERLPEAQDAQRQLDNLVDSWQKELDALEKEWQEKYEDYDKRKLILTDQGRANAERELQALDAQIMAYRDAKFGQDGELFKKEDEIMRPIQNMIFDQINKLASQKDYDYVIDKSGGAVILYANEKHDLTDELIQVIETTLPARQTPAGTGFEQGGTTNTSGNSNDGRRQIPSGSEQPPMNRGTDVPGK